MKNQILSENLVKNVIFNVLNEEASKVKRDDYSRVQFRIEELENSLIETMKEFRKLENSLPDGLKTVANGRISEISNNLSNSHSLVKQLKDKIRVHKKKSFAQQVEEKKK
jgi:septal ring factor EnvC (AmiA/AmiB activator)